MSMWLGRDTPGGLHCKGASLPVVISRCHHKSLKVYWQWPLHSTQWGNTGRMQSPHDCIAYRVRTIRNLPSRASYLLVLWSCKHISFILNQSITIFQLSLPILPPIILICIFTDWGQKDRSVCASYIRLESLCWGFTAQSTQWDHVECGQFT